MVNIAENGGHNTGHLMFSSRVEARSQCYWQKTSLSVRSLGYLNVVLQYLPT
jgi:hypothetical protein